MKRAEAERRIAALTEWHQAVSHVLELTDFISDEINWHRVARPKPGRDADWHKAKARADQLVAGASRSFQQANIHLDYSPSGTTARYPIDPAKSWSSSATHPPSAPTSSPPSPTKPSAPTPTPSTTPDPAPEPVARTQQPSRRS